MWWVLVARMFYIGFGEDVHQGGIGRCGGSWRGVRACATGMLECGCNADHMQPEPAAVMHVDAGDAPLALASHEIQYNEPLQEQSSELIQGHLSFSDPLVELPDGEVTSEHESSSQPPIAVNSEDQGNLYTILYHPLAPLLPVSNHLRELTLVFNVVNGVELRVHEVTAVDACNHPQPAEWRCEDWETGIFAVIIQFRRRGTPIWVLLKLLVNGKSVQEWLAWPLDNGVFNVRDYWESVYFYAFDQVWYSIHNAMCC